MRMRFLLAALIACAGLHAVPVRAQDIGGVVSRCGAASYTPGTSNYITMGPTGGICGDVVRNGTTVATPTAAAALALPGQFTLFGFTVTAPASGQALAFDAASTPADGTVSPIGCWQIPSPISAGQLATLSMSNLPYLAPTVNGIVIVYSISGSCFTKQAGSPGFISVIKQ